MTRRTVFYPRIACFAAAVCSSVAMAQGVSPLFRVSTFAGTNQGYLYEAGDGGPALWAWVNTLSFARDSAGSLYIGERGTHLVRKITPAGTITTIAGTGVPGFSPVYAPGGFFLGASLGVAVDGVGNVYIADCDFNRVLKLTPSGAISTVAGTGANGDAGDGGPATAATLIQPLSLAMDQPEIFTSANWRVAGWRKLAPHGTISTLAANGQSGSVGDGGPAINAQVGPLGLAVDETGNVYMTDGNKIRGVTTDGIIHTIGGTGVAGFSGDGGPATTAQLNGPIGIAADHAGNIYVADTYNQRVRRIAAGTGIITTVAGTGTLGIRLGSDRNAVSSQLSYPVAVLPDDAGNLYIADNLINFYGLIRKVDANGKMSIFAGAGGAGDGGSATTAVFGRPKGVAVDATGNVYVRDSVSGGCGRSMRRGSLRTWREMGTADILAMAVPRRRRH